MHDKRVIARRRQRNDGAIARQLIIELGMTLPMIEGPSRTVRRKQGRIAVAFLRELGINVAEREEQNAIT